MDKHEFTQVSPRLDSAGSGDAAANGDDVDHMDTLAALAAYVAAHATPPADAGLSPLISAAGGAEGKRTSVMNEVFVLGRLMGRPLHGYLLRQIMSVALGPVRQMNWNTLYPLIHRLVEEGLIVPVEEADVQSARQHDISGERDGDNGMSGEGGRRRKEYRITPTGQERFQALMREQEGYTPDYPDLFNVKLSAFAHVAPATRVAILRHYQGFLQLLADFLRALYENSVASSGIPEADRPHIQQMIQHRWYLAQADLRWVDEAISREIASCADGPIPD